MKKAKIYFPDTKDYIGGELNVKPKIHSMMKKYFAPILAVAKNLRMFKP